MAEYTEHYGIAKHGPFGEGEALSAYSIVNVAMDTIDDILFEHKELIDALEARMDAVEARVTELESRMDTAESNITQIFNDIERIDQNIDEIETNINNIEQNIDTIETNINNIEQNIDQIENNISTIESNITSITQNVTQLESTVDSDSTSLWAAINNIVSKITGGGTVDSNSGSITWGLSGNIAVGNMSLFGNEGMTSYIRARTGTGANDVRAQ